MNKNHFVDYISHAIADNQIGVETVSIVIYIHMYMYKPSV